MLRRYNRWAVKQCTRAQCSPFLLVPLLILALAVLAYVYRAAILETLKVIALVIVTAIAVSGLSVVGFYGVRAFLHARQVRAAGPRPQPRIRKATGPVSSPTASDPGVVGKEGTFAETADWLADENTVLAWSSDGSTLLGGHAPTEKTPK